jgi:hypothetical protein
MRLFARQKPAFRHVTPALRSVDLTAAGQIWLFRGSLAHPYDCRATG